MLSSEDDVSGCQAWTKNFALNSRISRDFFDGEQVPMELRIKMMLRLSNT